MILFYPVLITSVRPLILVPGLYGSSLYATVENFDFRMYCPKSYMDQKVWVDIKYAAPLLFNCLFHLLWIRPDKDGQPVSHVGANISVRNFGSLEGIEWLYTNSERDINVPSLADMVQFLKKKGYEPDSTLFGAPYDWRMSVTYLETFYRQFKQLIEHAFRINGDQSVDLFAFSYGTNVVHHFLDEYVSADWAAKYVHKVMFLAPALGGSSDALVALWNKEFPPIPIYKTPAVRKVIETLPSLHNMLPNFALYEKTPVIISASGEQIPAKGVVDYLLQSQRILRSTARFMKNTMKQPTAMPAPLTVPCKILFNSGFNTARTLNFSSAESKLPEIVYAPGDTSVLASVVNNLCSLWSRQAKVECKDFRRSEIGWDHGSMTSRSEVLEEISEYFTSSEN